MSHALITGPIQGRIPDGNGGFVDVTPDVVYLETEEDVQVMAEAIEVEHAVRGSHPIQAECATLAPLNDAVNDETVDDTVVAAHLGVHDHKNVLKAHQAAHQSLNRKAGL